MYIACKRHVSLQRRLRCKRPAAERVYHSGLAGLMRHEQQRPLVGGLTQGGIQYLQRLLPAAQALQDHQVQLHLCRHTTQLRSPQPAQTHPSHAPAPASASNFPSVTKRSTMRSASGRNMDWALLGSMRACITILITPQK